MTQTLTQQSDQALTDLVDCWKNSPHPSVKITSYFPAYVELFASLRDTDCTFIETGILDGGSLFMWRNWLGKKARIIGIDLNPEAANGTIMDLKYILATREILNFGKPR